jgi:hypothetical protein
MAVVHPRSDRGEQTIMTSTSKIALTALLGAAVGGAAIHGLHAQAKPKAYTVTELETLDAKAAADFATRVAKMQESAGGRNLRTGGGNRTFAACKPRDRNAALAVVGHAILPDALHDEGVNIDEIAGHRFCGGRMHNALHGGEAWSRRCFALRFLWIVERHFCELGLADV